MASPDSQTSALAADPVLLAEFARRVAGLRKDGEGRDAACGDFIRENDDAFDLLEGLISDARGLFGIDEWSETTADPLRRWNNHRTDEDQRCDWSMCIVDPAMTNDDRCPARCSRSSIVPISRRQTG